VFNDCRVNRNNGDFFWNKLLVSIPETLYVDDYIHDYIQNFALNLFKRSDVSAKTEFSYSKIKTNLLRSYIKAEWGNNYER